MKLQAYIVFFIVIGMGISANAKEPYPPSIPSTHSKQSYSIYIMNKGNSSMNDMMALLQNNNPGISDNLAKKIAEIYIEESNAEGVNCDIAFCQMALETGFLTYKGSIKKSQNNFGGLGAVNKIHPGESFPNMHIGIRAHIQHLKAYASENDLQNDCVDSRFSFVNRASAPDVYALSGKWSTDPLYGEKLEGLLIRLINHTSYIDPRLIAKNRTQQIH